MAKRYHIKLSITENSLRRKSSKRVLHRELDRILKKLKKQLKEAEAE